MATRPDDLIYAVDDVPPLNRLAMLGAQHAVLLSVYLVLIVIVMRAGGATQAQTVSAVSLGMIAAAAGTVLQALRRGPVGSGFLAAPVFSAIYLGPSLLAAHHYGLAAVFGMTIFAGLVEILISQFLSHLRVFFPPAISGFIVAIVGIQLGLVGIEHVLNIEAVDSPGYAVHLVVSGVTLALIMGMSIWAGGVVRLMCSTIGIVIGFGLSIALGLVSINTVQTALSGPLLFLPDLGHIAYDFEMPLLPVFLIAGIAAALRAVGVVSTCQKVNDQDWKRPDLQSIKGGMLADGLGCVIAGLLGGIGQNTGPSLVGVSKASGATSRSIAYAAAAILLACAFVPAIGAFFILLPKAVIGATLVFTASFMITGGIQIMVSRNIDTRMTYVIGVALLLGLAREVYTDFFTHLPQWLQPLTSTALALAVASALLMHMVFRIGIRKTAAVAFEDNAQSVDELVQLLLSRGKAWGLDSDLLERAESTTRQVMTHIDETRLVEGELSSSLSYDELDLVITVNYRGSLLSLPNIGTRRTSFLEEESFSYGLADFLTGVYPDRMEASAQGSRVTVRLVFSS